MCMCACLRGVHSSIPYLYLLQLLICTYVRLVMHSASLYLLLRLIVHLLLHLFAPLTPHPVLRLHRPALRSPALTQ